MRLILQQSTEPKKLSFDAPKKAKQIAGSKERWVHVCKAGYLPLKGVEVTPKHFDQMVDNFYAETDALPVYFGHANLYEVGARARGWIIGLHAEDGNLYALIESGPELEKEIVNGGFRLTSIDADLAAKSRSKVGADGKSPVPIGARLNSIAVTNEPAVDGLLPIAASSDRNQPIIIVMNEDNQLFRSEESRMSKKQEETNLESNQPSQEETETVELQEGEVSPEEMQALLEDLLSAAKEASGQEEMDYAAAVAMAVEKLQTASEEEETEEEDAPTEAEEGAFAAERTALTSQINALQNDKVTLEARVGELEKRLEADEATKLENEIKTSVDKAIEEGKIHLSARGEFLSWAKSDFESFKKALPHMQAVAIGKRVTASNKDETDVIEDTLELSDHEKRILMGHEKAMKKSK